MKNTIIEVKVKQVRLVSPGTSFDIVYDSKYISFRTAQRGRSDNAHCHPYNDEVAIGCHGTGYTRRSRRGFCSHNPHDFFFIIVEVEEALQGKS